mmetsp:Transcript_34549/g.83588  ORF Transcript_34549/g.83588 Transcript_34549/m.83588 type:complete len:665 (-) Transcript_34549:265-2259(-)
MALCTADSHCTGEGDYENAAAALLSPLHQSTTPTAIRAAAARRRNTLHDMHVYLRRLGLDLNGDTPEITDSGDHTIPSLILHVTGTKGKGSTLSLCESILRNAHGLNTGMFTSPHLVSIRERIRINGVPVSREVFGRVYWTVRRRLERHLQGDNDAQAGAENEAVSGGGTTTTLPPLPVLPGYFRMLTLMALYTFCHYQHSKIDVILLEVGMGGRYDATNVFEPYPLTKAHSRTSPQRVLVRGITLIDYDHTRVLGSTLTQIAWEKGGICVRGKLENIGMDDGDYDMFVEGYAASKERQKHQSNSHKESSEVQSSSVVFASGKNTPEVLSVLRETSSMNDCQLQIVHDSSLESFPGIGLQGDHQRSNAALALAMCQYAAEKNLKLLLSTSEEKIRDALARTSWPGRCHTVPLACLSSDNAETGRRGCKPSINLRCDGAHTPISIRACIEWFRKVSTSNSSSTYEKVRRVLVFNCSHERNPLPLLFSLYHSNLFDWVYFCRADFERPSAVPKRLEDGWLREPLTVEGASGGVAVTFASMCAELETFALRNPAGGYDILPLDPLEISAKISWQHTLSRLWKVFDYYQRYCVVANSMSQALSNVTAADLSSHGLTVKEAISEIKKSETLSATNDMLVEVCVTGSLYLVGSALEAAGWEECEALGTIC